MRFVTILCEEEEEEEENVATDLEQFWVKKKKKKTLLEAPLFPNMCCVVDAAMILRSCRSS